MKLDARQLVKCQEEQMITRMRLDAIAVMKMSLPVPTKLRKTQNSHFILMETGFPKALQNGTFKTTDIKESQSSSNKCLCNYKLLSQKFIFSSFLGALINRIILKLLLQWLNVMCHTHNQDSFHRILLTSVGLAQMKRFIIFITSKEVQGSEVTCLRSACGRSKYRICHQGLRSEFSALPR